MLAAAGGVITLLLDRRRLVCWEADWSAADPQAVIRPAQRRQRCSSLSRVASRSRPRCSRWRIGALMVPLS